MKESVVSNWYETAMLVFGSMVGCCYGMQRIRPFARHNHTLIHFRVVNGDFTFVEDDAGAFAHRNVSY